ncbi:hypothetical protein ES703_50462 [subsurface metagenome]
MEDIQTIDKEESESKILNFLIEPRSFGAVEIAELTKLSPRTTNKRLKSLIDKGYVKRDGIKYQITEEGREYQTRLIYKFTSEKISDFNPKIISGISMENPYFNLTASSSNYLTENKKKKFKEGLKKIEEEYSNLMRSLEIESSSCNMVIINSDNKIASLEEK